MKCKEKNFVTLEKKIHNNILMKRGSVESKRGVEKTLDI